jgi:hypothetical protein
MFCRNIHLFLLPEDPQGLKEKAVEGRMREQQCKFINIPLTLTLSLREREL